MSEHEQCIGPLSTPDNRSPRMCHCESKGLPKHECEERVTFTLKRPMAAKRDGTTPKSLTRGWHGGDLPLCRSCAKQYRGVGYKV
jgi:hypothetical protein